VRFLRLRLRTRTGLFSWNANPLTKPLTENLASFIGPGDHPPTGAAEKKHPAKAAVVGTSQGTSKQRLRSESNRRRRICDAVAEPVSPWNGSDSRAVPTKVPEDRHPASNVCHAVS